MFPWNIFPFNKDSKNMLQQMKPEEIDKYVQDIMEKMIPGTMRGMMNPQDMLNQFQSPIGSQQSQDALQSTTFETHDFVFVRIPIKNEEWLKQMAIYHTSNKLLVEHIPNYEDKHSITLPAIVRKKGAAANYRDGILEVRIPKNIDMQFSQIDVTEI
ncbi:Hsp20/alpha crystallin family protein [Neobacillus sp. SM06]|uniref:Hsp20/alpha crystallin family protein n=1 Tax=Neobacillus sp. SM06 TaxID=3422492 RepID=UPI003D29E055